MGLSSLGRNLQHYHLGTARVTEEMEILELKWHHKVTPHTQRHRSLLREHSFSPALWILAHSVWDEMLFWGWPVVYPALADSRGRRMKCLLHASEVCRASAVRKPGFYLSSCWESPSEVRKRKHWYFFKALASTPGNNNGKCLRCSRHIHGASAVLPAWWIHFMRFL